MSTDPPNLVNIKLQKYGATLFDFAYYLAIVLNEQFRPRSFFGHDLKEILKIQSLLKNIEKMLTPYAFLRDLLTKVRDKQKVITQAGIVTHRGKPLDKKTQLILFWTEYLKKNRLGTRLAISNKEDHIDKRTKLIRVKAEVSVVDWDTFYRLLFWFYSRLKECLYFKCIQPDQNRNKEIRNSKLRLHMSRLKYTRPISIVYSHYVQVQEYFRKKSKELPIKITWDGFFYSNAYPIAKINFNKDNIIIGELREKGIMLEKFRFTENGKVIKEAHCLKKHEGIKTPSVIFPDGVQFPT